MRMILFRVAAFAMLTACGSVENQRVEQNAKALAKEEQARLTPAGVIEILKKGNQEFENNRLTVRNNTDLVREAAKGQYPMAVILSCIDSRVPVEDVFHCAIGDIFVARVAGNIVNVDILGSMEYACAASGAKLVMVLGHGSCGAIKSAIDDVQLGNITELLSKIKPAVSECKAHFDGETTTANSKFVETVGHTNVVLAVTEIRRNSPILKEMEEKGQIKIIGAYYDMYTGKVDFFENL